MNVLMRHRMPLTLNVGFSGNVGGYRSKADPDEELDRYSRVRDNVFRGFIDMQWLLNKNGSPTSPSRPHYRMPTVDRRLMSP